MKEDWNMVEDIKADETLDARGIELPYADSQNEKAGRQDVRPGQILEILSTDPGTGNDLPSFAKRGGHEYLGEKADQGFHRYYIRVG